MTLPTVVSSLVVPRCGKRNKIIIVKKKSAQRNVSRACNKNVTEKNWIVNFETAKINIFLLLSAWAFLSLLSRLWFTINNQDRSINGWTTTANEKKYVYQIVESGTILAEMQEADGDVSARRKKYDSEMANALLQIAAPSAGSTRAMAIIKKERKNFSLFVKISIGISLSSAVAHQICFFSQHLWLTQTSRRMKCSMQKPLFRNTSSC